MLLSAPPLLATSALLALAGRLVSASPEDALAAVTVINLEDVRGNLHLPSSSDGFDISWQSSDDDVVTSEGIVTRPSTDAQVILTASVQGQGEQYEREFNASVRQAVQLDPFEGYAFSYFTGDSLEGENIFFAASEGNDALTWQELNDGEPVLTSERGTGGLRDPFIIRSPEGDTFYMIATDLSIGSGTSWGEAVRQGSLYLEIWESHDLVNWSEQRHVRVSPSNAGNTWAPEAFWDAESGSYAVFWASSLYDEDDPDHEGGSYHRMLYSLTRDFVNFGEPQVWQDAGDARIDTTVLESGGTLYRFTKDEGAATGCTDIIQESSDRLLAPLDDWAVQATCIGDSAGLGAVEGPTAFRANPDDVHGDKFYLFVDEYGGQGYVPLETDDLNQPEWQVSSSYNLPSSPRHGTVIPVTAAEHEALLQALSARRRSRNVPIATRQTGSSPVLPGLWADPNIAVVNNTYYIYATTDGFEGWEGNEFYWWSSSDLVSWTRGEEPFLVLDGDDGNVPWATGNAWAPGFASRDGKYYIYFSGENLAVGPGHKTIGVAVADHPEGPFTAEPEAMILGTDDDQVVSAQTIDPAAFHDPQTGKWYLYWGSGGPDDGPVAAELEDDMVSLKEGSFLALEGLVDFREALFLNYREGIYHMTYSIDDTRSEDYRVGYATADNALGPWTYRGVILEKDPSLGIYGTGHNSVLNVPGTDDWFIIYHRFAIPDGGGFERETTIDRIEIDPDTGFFLPVTPTLEGVGPQEIPSI